MNKVQLHGFTGKDPDVKTLDSGKKIAKFTIATTSFRKDKDGNKITDWHSIIAWEKLADLTEKYIKKGSELIVEGEISYRDYVDKDGVKKYFTEIICNGIEFCGKKEEAKQDEPKASETWQGKKEVKAMSDVNELPGNINDGSIPDELSDLPF
jgi:single-strand DNA-binding protein